MLLAYTLVYILVSTLVYVEWLRGIKEMYVSTLVYVPWLLRIKEVLSIYYNEDSKIYLSVSRYIHQYIY